MVEEIREIVMESARKACEDQGIDSSNLSLDTELIGQNGILDSLGFVTLATELEIVISEKFNKDIVMVDDDLMGGLDSPFRTINTLAENVLKQLTSDS